MAIGRVRILIVRDFRIHFPDTGMKFMLGENLDYPYRFSSPLFMVFLFTLSMVLGFVCP